MMTIPLKLNIKALDAYLYGGYLFLIMQDGDVLYGKFDKIVNRIVRKYEKELNYLKVAFLRNEYYYSNPAKAFIKIPSVKEALIREWERYSQEEFELNYDEIQDLLQHIFTCDSLPLDVKIYAMRLYVGCRKGLYEAILNDTGRTLEIAKSDRCFEGKVIQINPKYGELVVSADTDGLFAKSIELETDKLCSLDEKDVVCNRSLRTNWSDTDVYNYDSANTFSFISNEYVDVPRKKNHYWEKIERKRITKFGAHQSNMSALMEKLDFSEKEVRYCFNGADHAYFQMNDGRLIVSSIKDEDEGIYFSNKKREPLRNYPIGDFGRVLSGTTIPQGLVFEFFDNVVLYKNKHLHIIEDKPVLKVRSFMSSNRYQDILAITMEDCVRLHAIDTLGLERKPISPRYDIGGRGIEYLPSDIPCELTGNEFRVNDNDLPF